MFEEKSISARLLCDLFKRELLVIQIHAKMMAYAEVDRQVTILVRVREDIRDLNVVLVS